MDNSSLAIIIALVIGYIIFLYYENSEKKSTIEKNYEKIEELKEKLNNSERKNFDFKIYTIELEQENFALKRRLEKLEKNNKVFQQDVKSVDENEYGKNSSSENNSLELKNNQYEEDYEVYEEGEIITPEQLKKQEEQHSEELAYISFDAQERAIENTLIARLKNIMTNNFSSNKEQELSQLSKDIFGYCLSKSNKDVNFEDISNVGINDILNNSTKIFYAPIYRGLKETIFSIPLKYESEQKPEARSLFYGLTTTIIPQINQI
jgi:hypothetical protein